MFSQDASRFTVEFPRGPLMIRNGLVVDVLTLHEDDSILQIISPTDAVCDRLNKYAAWDDFSALRAAVGIARAADVNLAAVRAFLEREGRGVFAPRYAEAWRIFDRRVRETP